MPIAYYAQYAYYAYYAPPKKHQWGRHLPRRGKESATPFYPDAGRIAPIHARVLSLSLMSAFTPRSSFRCPSP